jgi:hypothetical protein
MSDSTTPQPLQCQSETLVPGSSPVLRMLDLAYRTRKHLREQGVRATFKKVVGFLAATTNEPAPKRARHHSPKASVNHAEVLNLQAGELVEVKTEEEIAGTLDEQAKHHGLAFLPAMRPFCGNRFRVFKRVERIYLEESGEVRQMKNTVLLQGVHCDGLLMGCDRACFFYWREAWLSRVAENAGTGKDAAASPAQV